MQRISKIKRNIIVAQICNILVAIDLYIQLLPPLRILPFYNFLWFTLMITWFSIIIIGYPRFLLNAPLLRKIMVLFVLYTIIIPFFFNNSQISNRFISLAQIPFLYFVYEFNTKYIGNKANLRIIKWTAPIIIFVCIMTVIGLWDSPFLSRAISVGADTQTLEPLRQSIGGYDFIYLLSILTVIIFCVLWILKGRKFPFLSRLFLWGLFSLFFLCVVLSNFLTALIIIIVSIIIFLIFNKDALKRFTLLFLLIIALGIISSFKIEIIKSLINIFPPGETVNRLTILENGFLHRHPADLYSGRSTTLTVSIDAFTDNPIFGLVTKKIKEEAGFFSLGFGQHSQILDTFALFGFVIGLLQVYIIIKPFIQRCPHSNKSLLAFSMAVLLSTLIVNIFDNTAALIAYGYFFVYPTIYLWLKYKMTYHE